MKAHSQEPHKQQNFPLLRRLLRNKAFWALAGGGLFLNLAGWAVLFWGIEIEEAPVILHYNAFLGIDAINFNLKNHPFLLFGNNFSGAIIWLINLIGGLFLWAASISSKTEEDQKKKVTQQRDGINKGSVDRLGAYLLWSGGCVIQMIVLIYAIALVLVNR